jgi:hypothetical protein
MRKAGVEVYLRPKISSYCLQENISLKHFVCVPTFVQIRRGLPETRTKCDFGTSKKYSCIVLFLTKFTVF